MITFLRISLIIGLFCWCSYAKNDNKCRALVLSATTDKGAYHAGILDAISKKAVDPSEFEYDVVVGTSIGAINAAIIAKHSPGQEKAAAEELMDLWSTLTREQVYKFWSGGYVNGALFKMSLVDSSPFQNFLWDKFDPPFKRKLVIGASNSNNGEYETFYEQDLDQIQNIINLLLSTTAIPLYFPSINWKHTSYFDGSLLHSADVESAILRCAEQVSNQSDIIIDIITPHNGLPVPFSAQNYKTLKVFVRALEISLWASESFQLYKARKEYPDVHFRYIFQPSELLPGTMNPLSFDHEDMAEDIRIGQKDGEAVLKTGKFGNGAEIIEKATEWLHKTHGMFSKGVQKVKEINQRLREQQME